MPNGNAEQQYLSELHKFLSWEVKKGRMAVATANAEGRRAEEMLKAGAYGIDLPHWGELTKKGRWNVREPGRLSAETAQALMMPPDLRYYTGLGLTPSQALSWTKYMKPEEEEVKPDWTIGWEGKTYTPEQWGAVWPALKWKDTMERDWRMAQLQGEVGRLELRLKESAGRAMGRSKAQQEYGWTPQEGSGRQRKEQQLQELTGEAPADLYKRYLVGGQ